MVLEVFIVPGINDTNQEMEALQKAAERIRPDAIQLNRLDRPGADGSVQVASDELLALLVQSLAPLPVFAVPARRPGEARRVDDHQVEQAILNRLEARTHDTTTLAFLLGLNEGVVAKCVRQMLADGRLLRVPTLLPQRLVVRKTPDRASVQVRRA
jgi:hypothetical protein